MIPCNNFKDWLQGVGETLFWALLGGALISGLLVIGVVLGWW